MKFAIFLGLLLSNMVWAATDQFKSQFDAFVGHYEIVGCSARVLHGSDPKEKVNQYCDRKYVHIFLGDDYQEKADGSIYFFTLSDSLTEPSSGNDASGAKWVGIDLATDPAAMEDGEHGISVNGSSIWYGKEGTVIDQSTITEVNGLVYLHHNLTWPAVGENFLYNDMVLVLKKLN